MADDKKQVIQLVSSLDDTGFKKAKKEIGEITKEQVKQEAQTNKNTLSMGALAVGTAAVAAAAYTAKKAFDFFAQSVDAFAEDQRAGLQLEGALRSTGKAAIFTAEELKAMAAEFQKFSTVGDETIMQAQAIALQFEKLGREEMPRLIKTAIDVSARMGMDLPDGDAFRQSD